MPGLFGILTGSYTACVSKYYDTLSIRMASMLEHDVDWFASRHFHHQFGFCGVTDFGDHLKANIASLNGKNVLIYGDIYSYGNQEIPAKNRAETILFLYEKEGLTFLKQLNGSFALSIYDEQKNRLIIETDKYGSRNVFYSTFQNGFIYSSEIKAILAEPTLKPQLNLEAVTEFLTFSYLLGDKTFLRGIELIPPASIFIYYPKENKYHIERYWKFEFRRNEKPKTPEAYLKEFDLLMERAVELKIRDVSSVGLFLSGGADSRLLAGYAKRVADKKGIALSFITFGTKGGWQQEIAAKVADTLGVEYRFYELKPDWIAKYAEEIVYKGDGHLRIRDAHFIKYLSKIREQVDKVLVGFSCDSLFGTHLDNSLSRISNLDELTDYLIKKFRVRQVADYIPYIFSKKYYMKYTIDLWVGLNDNFLHLLSLDEIAHYWELRQRLRRYIFPLINYINWYVKAEDPYLDHEVVKFATGLPLGLKKGKFFIYYILRYNFPDLARIKFEHATPLDTLSYKLSRIREMLLISFFRALEKMSFGRILFIPKDYRAYDYWIRTGSRKYIEQMLLQHLKKELFDHRQVRKILIEHMREIRNNDQIICDLLNLTLFLKIFFYKIN